MKGYPCPWLPNYSNAPNQTTSDDYFNTMVEKTLQKVLEWSSLMCGFIFEKEDMFLVDGGIMDEEQLSLIRDERMASVLTSEVIPLFIKILEEDPKWLDYTNEEAEILIIITDMILSSLLSEIVHENLEISA